VSASCACASVGSTARQPARAKAIAMTRFMCQVSPTLRSYLAGRRAGTHATICA
jgi:hypothetical protein